MLDQISYICLHATDLTVIRGHTKVPLEKFIACNGCTRYTLAMFLICFPNFYSLNLKICNSVPKCYVSNLFSKFLFFKLKNL